MMYNKSRPRFFLNAEGMRRQRLILLSVCIVLLAAVIVLGFIAVRNGAYRGRTEIQFRQRMISACASAVDEVNRMTSITASNSASRLARVRQQIYYMEQLNAISLSLNGEGGRLVPADTFTVLFNDLDSFESLLQQATASTMDVRTNLLDHLTTLQAFLSD